MPEDSCRMNRMKVLSCPIITYITHIYIYIYIYIYILYTDVSIYIYKVMVLIYNDCVTMKIPYRVDVLLHQPVSHPVFSCWVG